MYSVINNMRHSRWLAAIAALWLVGAAWQHMAAMRGVSHAYRNEAMAAALDMLAASIQPVAVVDNREDPAFADSACDAAQHRQLANGMGQLDAELARITGAQAGADARTLVSYRLDRGALEDAVGQAKARDAAGTPGTPTMAWRCGTLVDAVQWLLRKSGGATRVSLLEWRGQRAGAAPLLATSQYLRSTDPWQDLSGCLLMRGDEGYVAVAPSGGEASARLCASAFADGQARMAGAGKLPAVAIAPTTTGVRLQGDATGNTVEVHGRPVPQGPHYVTTIDARTQSIVQQVADCYTGGRAACAALGIDPRRWEARAEQASVRMAGVLVIDIASGAIEAAGSAHTPCFTRQFAGPARGAGCLRLPAAPGARPHELENHALFTSYMPGSLVKPVLAMGLLRDPALATRLHGVERDKFLGEISHSDSAAFLDRVFCRDTGFTGCARPDYVMDAAAALGWNGHCGDGSELLCARTGALTGLPAYPGGESPTFFSGLLGMTFDPLAGRYKRLDSGFSPDSARDCSAQPGALSWRRCKSKGNGAGGNQLVALASETWGQGNALATPVGIAAMLSRLGMAANQAPATPAWPHLLHGAIVQRGGRPAFVPLAPVEAAVRPVAGEPRDARLVLSGMAQTHWPARGGKHGAQRAGTASSACIQAFGSAAACAALEGVAGKTGTPPFAHDRLTAAQRETTCARIRADLEGLPDDRWSPVRARWVDCMHRPIKWYAALLKDHVPPGKAGADAPWTRAVVVIVERNWTQAGLIDSPGDTGPNAAAEVAFQVIRRLRAAPSIKRG